MTITSPANKQSGMHSARQQEYYRRLDRVLAARYVAECMLHRDRRSRTPNTQNGAPQLWQPRMLLCDDPQSTRISATLELPGIAKDDLVIDREGDRLIISGERRSPFPSDPALAATKYPIQELKYGKYRRVIDLAPGTQASTLSFLLKDGMLVITWPRTPAVSAVHRLRIEERRRSDDRGNGSIPKE